VVHVPDPYHGIQRGWDSTEDALARLDEIIQLEGPTTIAAFIVEPVTGTNGVTDSTVALNTPDNGLSYLAQSGSFFINVRDRNTGIPSFPL
jgi:hypothetical protein